MCSIAVMQLLGFGTGEPFLRVLGTPLRGGEMLDASTGGMVGCCLRVSVAGEPIGVFAVHLRRGKVLWLKVCVFDAVELMMVQSRKRKNTIVEGLCLGCSGRSHIPRLYGRPGAVLFFDFVLAIGIRIFHYN